MDRRPTSLFATLAGYQLRNEFWRAYNYATNQYRRQAWQKIGLLSRPRQRMPSNRLILGSYRGGPRGYAAVVRRRRGLKRKSSKRPRGVGRAYRVRRIGSGATGRRTRARKSAYRPNLGEGLGAHPSRKYLHTIAWATKSDKTLYHQRLVKVPWSADEEALNRRSGRYCDVVGVKLRYWFAIRNEVETSALLDHPIQVRWAIINPKTNTGTIADISPGSDFFMSDSPTADLGMDFPTTGNCFKYQNRRINTRKYGVVQQGTFVLQLNTASNNTRTNKTSKKLISTWVPIRRQMKWGTQNNATDEESYPNANLHFVYWFTGLGDSTSPGLMPDALGVWGETLAYFRNASIVS